MSDELQQVENAGEELIGVYADTFKIVQSFVRELREFDESVPQLPKRKPKSNNFSDLMDSGLTSFQFTGQDTDLCYFAQSDKMSLTAIANIDNENIKKAVLSNFGRFIENGSLELKDGYLHITAKGKQYIKNEFFIRQIKADQTQAHNKGLVKSAERDNTKIVTLTGNGIDDFTYFYYSNQLDLNDVVSNPNKKLSDKIMNNAKIWHNNGTVTVSNGIATITPKGKTILNSSEFQKEIKNYLHPKELADFNVNSSKFAVKIQTAVQTQAQQNILKNTVKKAIKR